MASRLPVSAAAGQAGVVTEQARVGQAVLLEEVAAVAVEVEVTAQAVEEAVEHQAVEQQRPRQQPAKAASQKSISLTVNFKLY